MFRVAKWIKVGLLTTVISLGATADAGALYYHPYGYFAYPFVGGYHPTYYGFYPAGGYSTPFYPFGSYGYGYYGDVYAYLNGASNVIAAQGYYQAGAAQATEARGRYLTHQQQAALAREQTISAWLANRQTAQEQALREYKNTPSREEVREKTRGDDVRRAQNAPPIAEILSGKSLNDLLVDLQRLRTNGIQGRQIALQDDLLRQIATTNGRDRVHPGILGPDGKLNWPVMLRDAAFQAERDQLDRTLAPSFRNAGMGAVNTQRLEECRVRVQAMQEWLDSLVQGLNDQTVWTPGQWCKANGFLRDCDNAIRAMQDYNIRYLVGTYAAKGNTVGELVTHMTENGLRFGPCPAGNASAYLTLHRHLADFSIAAHAAAKAAAGTKAQAEPQLASGGQ